MFQRHMFQPLAGTLESTFLLAFLCPCNAQNSLQRWPIGRVWFALPPYRTYSSSCVWPSCIFEDCLFYLLKQNQANQEGKSTPIMYFKLLSHPSPYKSILNHIQTRKSQDAVPSDPHLVTETGQAATLSRLLLHFKQVLTTSRILACSLATPSILMQLPAKGFRTTSSNPWALSVSASHLLQPPRPTLHPLFVLFSWDSFWESTGSCCWSLTKHFPSPHQLISVITNTTINHIQQIIKLQFVGVVLASETLSAQMYTLAATLC